MFPGILVGKHAYYLLAYHLDFLTPGFSTVSCLQTNVYTCKSFHNFLARPLLYLLACFLDLSSWFNSFVSWMHSCNLVANFLDFPPAHFLHILFVCILSLKNSSNLLASFPVLIPGDILALGLLDSSRFGLSNSSSLLPCTLASSMPKLYEFYLQT